MVERPPSADAQGSSAFAEGECLGSNPRRATQETTADGPRANFKLDPTARGSRCSPHTAAQLGVRPLPR